MNIIYPAGVPCDTHTHTQTDAHRHRPWYGNNGWGLIPKCTPCIAPHCSRKPLSHISPVISKSLAWFCRSAHPLPSPGFEAHFRLKSCTPLPLIIKIETNWAHPCRRCSRLFTHPHFLRRWGPVLFQLIQLWDSPFPFPVLPSSH